MEDGGIDAGLTLLLQATPRGVERSLPEIAYVCGCHKNYIWLLEQSALKKIRRSLHRRGITPTSLRYWLGGNDERI